jgi:hypothetical protein
MSIALTSPTLGRLLFSVRNLLNQPNAANSFWTDAEIVDYINEGIRTYFAEVSNVDEGQFTTNSDLNIVAGSETVALPSACFEIKALYKKVANGYDILPYNNNITSGYTTLGGTDTNGYLPYYFFRENSIVLRPTPQFSETAGLRIEYIAFPDFLNGASDTLPAGVSPIFKQLIEMYAVYKAKLKESLVNGVDTTALAKENLNQIYVQFKSVIVNRSKYPIFTVPFSPESEY